MATRRDVRRSELGPKRSMYLPFGKLHYCCRTLALFVVQLSQVTFGAIVGPLEALSSLGPCTRAFNSTTTYSFPRFQTRQAIFSGVKKNLSLLQLHSGQEMLRLPFHPRKNPPKRAERRKKILYMRLGPYKLGHSSWKDQFRSSYSNTASLYHF